MEASSLEVFEVKVGNFLEYWGIVGFGDLVRKKHSCQGLISHDNINDKAGLKSQVAYPCHVHRHCLP